DQAGLAGVAAVGPGDRVQAGRQVLVSLVPGDAHEGVVAAVVEPVLLAQLGVVGQRRELGVGPLFPALAQHRPLEAVRAVDAGLHGVALGTAARVPGLGRLVAVEVAAAVVVVVLLAAEDDAVAHERPQPAHVRVVGGAHPGKAAVVAVLVVVDLLPAAR